MRDRATSIAPIRFPDRLRLRVPRGMAAAVELAASQHHTSPSEWCRQMLLRGLEADGVSIEIQTHSAERRMSDVGASPARNENRRAGTRSEGICEPR